MGAEQDSSELERLCDDFGRQVLAAASGVLAAGEEPGDSAVVMQISLGLSRPRAEMVAAVRRPGSDRFHWLKGAGPQGRQVLSPELAAAAAGFRGDLAALLPDTQEPAWCWVLCLPAADDAGLGLMTVDISDPAVDDEDFRPPTGHQLAQTLTAQIGSADLQIFRSSN